MAVNGAAGAVTRGVDSTAETSDALASGKQLAQEYGCIVGISGAEDLVRLIACIFLRCLVPVYDLDLVQKQKGS